MNPQNNKSYKGRHFVVRDKYSGIPIANQGYGPSGNEYGTVRECIDRLNMEVASCRSCGLDVSDKDYEIVDRRDGEIIL